MITKQIRNCNEKMQTPKTFEDVILEIVSRETPVICGEIPKYIALWRAVLVQQIQDARNNQQKTEFLLVKKTSTLWLDVGNPDFRTVCDYAFLDPWYVMRLLNKAKQNNYRWRKE